MQRQTGFRPFRAVALDPHGDYLKTQKDIRRLAALLWSEAGTETIGSVMIVNVDSLPAAKGFADGDPVAPAAFASTAVTRMRNASGIPRQRTTAYETPGALSGTPLIYVNPQERAGRVKCSHPSCPAEWCLCATGRLKKDAVFVALFNCG